MKKALGLLLTTAMISAFAVSAFASEDGGGFVASLAGKGMKEDGSAYKVGLMYSDLDSEYIIWQEEYLKYMLEAAGCETTVVNTHTNTAEESDAIDDFIEAGFDCVIGTSVSTEDAALYNKLLENGIKVIDVARNVTDLESSMVCMTSNNVDCGTKCIEYMMDLIGGEEATLMSVQGYMGASDAYLREEGYEAVLAEHENCTYKAYPCEWSSVNAEAAVIDEMTANPGLTGILSHSDAMTAGVKSGLAQSEKLIKVGEEGHIYWVSIDGGPAGLQAIRDGYMDADIQQNPIKNAITCAKAVLEYLIPGKEIPVHYYEVGIDVIDASNVDTGDWWGDYDIENTKKGIDWASTQDFWENECPI